MQPHQEKTIEKWALVILSLVVVTYIGCLLSDYGKVFIHPELTTVFNPGEAPKSFFAFSKLEGDRGRFVSHGFMLANAKLRLWLFKFIPLHPTFSVTWLFTLF